MEVIIPPRDHGKKTWRYTWDEDGQVRDIETLHRIDEGSQPSTAALETSPEIAQNRLGRQTVAWPFHHHTTSEVPSTPLTAMFRRATWQPRNVLRLSDADSITSRSVGSLIPDYVVNYIRGETPETLARKKEKRQWGERTVNIVANRETLYSHTPELGGGDVYRDGRPLLSRNENRPRGLGRFIHGWRGGVVLNTLLALIILIVAVICLIVAGVKSRLLAQPAAFYSGSCSTAGSINTGLHALINVFAVILLASANYVFQILSSPTRPELTAAHQNKRWLDIGIPSMRNFLHISSFRGVLAIIIVVIAIATQIIYNSVIFTSQGASDYEILVVADSFLTNAQFSNDTAINAGHLSRLEILSLQDAANRNMLTNLTTEDCLQQFSQELETSFDAVLLVTNLSLTTNSLLQTASAGTSLSTYTNSNNELFFLNTPIQYCLARPATAAVCSVYLNGPLLGIVALLNLATVISLGAVLMKRDFQPLVTLGDAIRSFLHTPDATTVESCLLTKSDVWQGRWGFHEPKYFTPVPQFDFATPSLPRWVLVILSWVAVTAAAIVGLAFAMHAGNPLAGTFSDFTESTNFSLQSVSLSAQQVAILAAVPQVLLAILYLAANSLLTTYYLSHESCQFALGPRPLRVSGNPEGAQVTSLYLTLPRPISWALLLLFAAMGFAMSEAILPSAVDFYSATAPAPASQQVDLSLNSLAFVVLLALLGALMLLVVGLGFRRTPPCILADGRPAARGVNPLALPGGSCSAVIAARAARRPQEPEPWLHPVGWGVVHESDGMQVGRCGFSALNTGYLDVGKCYA